MDREQVVALQHQRFAIPGSLKYSKISKRTI